MVYNEAVFLPLWLAYYSQFFVPKDIYVLDNGTTDGSIDREGFNRILIASEKVDWGWHRDKIQQLQHDLIERYEIVLCTDVDEIVAPDQRRGTLADYLDNFTDEFVNCTGYELIHMKDTEAPIDLNRPILEQRSHWFPNPVYGKPLLARIPMQWHGGFHALVDARVNPDPDLYLIHLHRMDYDICFARHQQRAARPWNKRDVQEGWGYQNRITDPEQFARWFYEDSCWAGFPLRVERIPDHWRGVF